MSSFLEAIFRKMQHIYVIMMTLSALVIACQSSDTRQKCLFPYKYDGVSSENNTSLARCEVLCQRHATCTHFNWICTDKRCAGSRDDPMEEMGTCKLYKGPTSKRLMMKSPQQAWCGRRFYNYRCNFDEIPLLKVEDLSWDQCINLCDLNHQCTHTVLRSNKTQKGYAQRYGICLLFSSEWGANTKDAQLLSMATSNYSTCELITLKYPLSTDNAKESNQKEIYSATKYLVGNAKLGFMITFGKSTASHFGTTTWH